MIGALRATQSFSHKQTTGGKKIMFEISGVSEEVAREALRLAMHKLPIKCKFVMKESGE